MGRRGIEPRTRGLPAHVCRCLALIGDVRHCLAGLRKRLTIEDGRHASLVVVLWGKSMVLILLDALPASSRHGAASAVGGSGSRYSFPP